jgi:HAD superfamily hydrolase (TIGR01509 family)
LVEAKRPVYLRRARAGLRPFEGAALLVQRLAERGPVGVVSGALRDEIELGLEVLAVADRVRFVVSAEDTAASKPDPDGYLQGIRQLTPLVGEMEARRALVVEDSLAGIEAAKAAGLPCVAVAHSYEREKLAAAGADLVVENVAALDDARLAELYRRLHG